MPQALALAPALRLPVEPLAVIPRTGFDAGGKAAATARLSPAPSGACWAYAVLDGCVAFTVATAYGGDSLIVPVASCV